MAEWLSSLGPGIANHLWQSTAFAVAAWLVTLALRTNQARARHAVWLAASVKFLVPFSLLVAAGNLLPHPRPAVAPVVYSAMDGFEEPFADAGVTLAAPVAPVPTVRERIMAALPVWLCALWVVGAGVVLVAFAIQGRKVRRTLRGAEVACAGPELEILRRLEERFAVQGSRFTNTPCGSGGANARSSRTERYDRAEAGPSLPGSFDSGRDATFAQDDSGGNAGIELRLSRARMEPGIFGIVRPVLVWPRELSARLDDAQIEAVLAHELVHVRRWDNLTAVVHMLVEAVFWFHPLVWWMERQIVKEREQACDEAVVAHVCGGQTGDAEVYAEALLKTCRFCVESPLVCVAGVTGADLKRRVLEIATGRTLLRMSWPKKALLAMAAVCVVAAPVVLGQAKAAQRMMLATIKVAPKPLQAATRAMIANEGAAQSGTPAGNGDDASPGPAFEVATIRPSMPEEPGPRFNFQGRHFSAMHTSVNDLFDLAYGLQRSQILGAPDWAASNRYDISAVSDSGNEPGMKQWQSMVRKLMVDRFQLRFHYEQRELPVYALTVGKGGAKVKRSDPAEPGHQRGGPGNASVANATMADIADFLSHGFLDRPVVDRTGLAGKFDLTLQWTPDEMQSAPQSAEVLPGLFTAIQEQVGLKLTATKAPVNVLVIDRFVKPSVDGAEVMGPRGVIPMAMVQEKPAAGGDASALLAAYDVASVRPVHPDRILVQGMQEQPDGINGQNMTVGMLVHSAYGAPVPVDDGVTGLPDWAKSMADRYSVQAKLNAEQVAALAKLSKDEQHQRRRAMLQALLTDRFKLKVHLETRQVPSYDLLVANGGIKMKELTASDPGVFIGSGGKPLVKGNSMQIANGGSEIIVQSFPMNGLTALLSSEVDHRVVDKTGLTGTYSYTLTFAISHGVGPAGGPAEAVASDPAPTVFQALEEQLGLRLQRGTATVDVVVVDHIERPSEN